MNLNKQSLLFTKGDWSIYRSEYQYAGSANRVQAYAYHKVCAAIATSEEPTNCWHLGDVRQTCILCDGAVPEGIQALILLYQWKP